MPFKVMKRKENEDIFDSINFTSRRYSKQSSLFFKVSASIKILCSQVIN